jgi:hypothetical protein
MNMTELWFLKESVASGTYDFATDSAGYTVRTPKFGYDECYIDIDDTRYLVRHRTQISNEGANWGSSVAPNKNVIFYIQKFKKKVRG